MNKQTAGITWKCKTSAIFVKKSLNLNMLKIINIANERSFSLCSEIQRQIYRQMRCTQHITWNIVYLKKLP